MNARFPNPRCALPNPLPEGEGTRSPPPRGESLRGGRLGERGSVSLRKFPTKIYAGYSFLFPAKIGLFDILGAPESNIKHHPVRRKMRAPGVTE